MPGFAVNRVARRIVVRLVRFVAKYGGRGEIDGDPANRPRGTAANGARRTVFSMSSSMKALCTNPTPLPICCRV
jgi:hypothetical protein